MPSGNQTQAFGYPLHRDEQRGSPVELAGVPQIPEKARAFIQEYGDGELLPHLEQQADEAIEAACWVLTNRRHAQRRNEKFAVVPQRDDEEAI